MISECTQGTRYLGYKYWWVKPPEINTEEFFATCDPENRRHQEQTYRKADDVASNPAARLEGIAQPRTK